jgi:hypothetical protein
VALTRVGSVPVAVLCPELFTIFADVGLNIALQLAGLLQIQASLGISLIIPDIALSIVLVEELITQFTIAIAFSLPNLNVQLAIALGAKLALVEAILALLQPLVAAGSAGLDAYSYAGDGAGFGPAVTAALAGGWQDGTPASANVTAIIFVATTTSTNGLGAGQVVSGALLPPPPPAPSPPPPPALPLPQYERGLASVSVSAAPIGGRTAVATLTVVGGAPTAIGIQDPGEGYTSPPTLTITDTAPVLGCSNTSPIVLTLQLTDDITTVTVTGVKGCTAANLNPATVIAPSGGLPGFPGTGTWNAKILSSTQIALYQDSALTIPSVGNGAWVPGTGQVTGNGTGAAAIATMGGGGQAAIGKLFAGMSFSGGLQAAGTLGLSALMPSLFEFLVGLLASLEVQAGQLKAQISATFNLPTTTVQTVVLLKQILASLKVALSAIPPMPAISGTFALEIAAQIKLVGSLFAELSAQLGLAAVELDVYTYSGPGSELGAELGVVTGPCAAVVLGATTSAASTALSVVFAGV